MESRKQLAVNKKVAATHNCAQAVATTYADYMGVSEEMASDMTAAFGLGMGTMEGTCGAIVGAGVVLSMVTKNRNVGRKQMAELITKFRKRNGATICSQLKGDSTGVCLRECNDCVADAAEFVEDFLKSIEAF